MSTQRAKMKEISLKEVEDKIKFGLRETCECGAYISTGPDEPKGDQAKFVALWFEDHSHEDLSKHGEMVREALRKMRGKDGQ